MKKEKTPRSKQRLWRGLTSVTASLLALSVAASPIVESYRTNIDSLLGTSSTKVVSDDEDSSELYSYVSDYSSTTELVQAIADLGEQMSEEGTVLLKNENSALPLTEEET